MYLYIKGGKILGLFKDKLLVPEMVDRIIEIEVDKTYPFKERIQLYPRQDAGQD